MRLPSDPFTITTSEDLAVAGIEVVEAGEAGLQQDAGDLRLEVRGGHLDVVAVGVQAVADAREEVCDGVGHRHRGYQLDFVMPGIMPSCWISRTQIRHRPNLRRYARGRPQRLQRL